MNVIQKTNFANIIQKEMKKIQLLTTIGFLLFIIGFVALVLSLVGVRLSMLSFLDNFGALTSFLAKIIMVVVGIVIIYISKSPEFRN